ncbi:hypothetical protein [Agrococcus baldri]|uniref:Uncharacterized protein n=1 Tax=Agrococcus baldri TaxID=153730 RepID=A0AA87REZ7_9MICO|nr:hypothetical protein [Agrococcus baldri]GEK81471.1 hypothetical protein ABA31_28220 [Agrococcus baldri]
MSTLTVLGTTGGVGATTLTALAIAAAQGQAAPAVEAVDPMPLARRLASDEQGRGRGPGLVHDAGRATPERCAAALERGTIAIVSAATPLGDAVLAPLLERIGAEELPGRVIVVRTALFGRPSRIRTDIAVDALLVPRDPLLTRPGRIADGGAGYRAQTRTALDRWASLTLQALRVR